MEKNETKQDYKNECEKKKKLIILYLFKVFDSHYLFI